MRRVVPLAVAALAFTLSGCLTAQEQRASDEAQCRSYGFKHDNDALAECLQRIELGRRAEMRDMRRLDPFREPMVIYRPVIVRRAKP